MLSAARTTKRDNTSPQVILLLLLFTADRWLKADRLSLGHAWVNNNYWLGLGHGGLFVWCQLLALGAVVYLVSRRTSPAVGSGLILLGGLSNLVDRLVIGGVVDYWHIPAVSVLNLADLMVVAGLALLVVDLSRKKPV